MENQRFYRESAAVLKYGGQDRLFSNSNFRLARNFPRPLIILSPPDILFCPRRDNQLSTSGKLGLDNILQNVGMFLRKGRPDHSRETIFRHKSVLRSINAGDVKDRRTHATCPPKLLSEGGSTPAGGGLNTGLLKLSSAGFGRFDC